MPDSRPIACAEGFPEDSSRLWEGSDVLLHGVGQLVASGHALDDNVLLPHARVGKRLLRAVEQRIDNCRVPPRVNDADSQSGSYTQPLEKAMEAVVALKQLPMSARVGSLSWRGLTVVALGRAWSFESSHCVRLVGWG